jgi:hypothetical protein
VNLRVSLHAPKPGSPSRAARHLLDPCGARVILGGAATAMPAAPIAAASNTLFGPRGALLCAAKGPLIISDTGHHRLLIWTQVPTQDDTPADLVIGQPDFTGDRRNGHGALSAMSLNVPTGLGFGAGVLAVADAWNHRVLLWHGVPQRSNQPADVVLGQADFLSGRANRGLGLPRADTLNWCYGVAISDGRLFVADTGNRRFLVWHSIPAEHGTPADLVLGQRDFITRDENGGGEDIGMGMRWPHAVVAADEGCFVADAGMSRVMAWRRMPGSNGLACDFVLGQSAFSGSDHNRGAHNPTDATMNMPYGMTQRGGELLVADTANSRLLGFQRAALGMGAPASLLAGQLSFGDKGDNRWGLPARDSLCWPYAIAACEDVLVIADSGNNRVLLWSDGSGGRNHQTAARPPSTNRLTPLM